MHKSRGEISWNGKGEVEWKIRGMEAELVCGSMISGNEGNLVGIKKWRDFKLFKFINFTHLEN